MNKLNKILTGVAAAVLAGQAMAASDGNISTTQSVGTSEVSLAVPDLVKISNVADIGLGTYVGTGNMTGQSQYCVFRNGGDSYQLKLTTDQTDYLVASGGGETIPFTVKVDDDSNAADGTALAYNTASGSLIGSPAANCGGTDNGAVEVTFAESDLQAASTTTYSATMTILVEPI